MKSNRKQDTNNHKHKLFQGSSHHFTSLPSQLWRIPLSSKGSSTKGPYTKELQLGLHKTKVNNSTNSTLYTRGSTKLIEITKVLVIQQDHKHSLTTSYKVEYEVLLKKLNERWNLVKKNTGALKPTENSFEKKELENWKV